MSKTYQHPKEHPKLSGTLKNPDLFHENVAHFRKPDMFESNVNLGLTKSVLNQKPSLIFIVLDCKDHRDCRSSTVPVINSHLLVLPDPINHPSVLPQNLICGECGDEFVLQSQLSAHSEEHRKELSGAKVFTCKACRKELPTAAQLKEHMRSHVRMRSVSPARPMEKDGLRDDVHVADKVKVLFVIN